MIEVKSFAALRRFSPEKLQKLNLFETERFFCDVYCLEPGQEQKAHAHPGSDKLSAPRRASCAPARWPSAPPAASTAWRTVPAPEPPFSSSWPPTRSAAG
jgi:hypothetical protein